MNSHVTSLIEAIRDALVGAASLFGTIRHTTTPNRANNSTGAVEVDDRGNALGSITISHERILSLAVAGAVPATYADALPEGPCDGFECSVAESVVFAQLRESPDIVWSRDPSDWTLGAGWADAGGGVVTHTPGSVEPLTLPVGADMPVLVGVTYALVYAVEGRTAGTVTESIGTAAGAARATNETFLIALTAAVDGTINFTPDINFDGSIDLAKIFIAQPVITRLGAFERPKAAVRVLGTATEAAPTALVASPATHVVYASWYRRRGAVQ